MKKERVSVCVRLKPLSREPNYPNVESCVFLNGSNNLTITPPSENEHNNSRVGNTSMSNNSTPSSNRRMSSTAKTPTMPRTAASRKKIFEACGIESEIDEEDKTMFLGETTELSKLPWIRTPTKGQSPALLLKGCLTPVELSRESPLFPASPSHTKSPRTPRTSRNSAPSPSPSYRRLSGVSKRDEAKSFIFDSILGEASSQADVFEKALPLVSAALEGFNSTVFVYGATGAGKTHTMIGETKARSGNMSMCEDDEEEEGILPRSIRHIFEETSRNRDTYSYSLHATFVEIYKDKICDLLDPSIGKRMTAAQRDEHDKGSKIDIRENVKAKTVYLTGSDTIRTPIKNFESAMELVAKSKKARRTGSTDCNPNSSRSHAVMIIHVERRDVNNPGAPACVGKLNLVDLAGSERINKSNVNGEAAKEATKINSHLTALGNVLSALSNPDHKGVIPYRNSKLTRLLQDSLGGNSKTLFFVNISTTAFNYRETLTTLQYGERAKKVQNNPTKNECKAGDVDSALRQEIARLRRALASKDEDMSTKDEELLMYKEQSNNLIEKNQQLEDDLMEVYEKTIAEQVEKQAEIDELALQATFHQAEYEFEKEQQEYEKYMKEVEAWTLRKDVARGEYELMKAKEETTEHISKSTEEITQMKTQQGEMTKKITELEDSLEENVSSKTLLLSEQAEKMTEMEEKLKEIERENEEKRSNDEESEEERERMKKEWKQEKKEMMKEKKAVEGKLDKSEETCSSLREELEEKKEELEEKKEELEEKKKELEEKKKELKEKKEELAKCLADLRKKEKEVRSLEKEVKEGGESSEAMAKLEAENEKLNEKVAQWKTKAIEKIQKLQNRIKVLEEQQVEQQQQLQKQQSQKRQKKQKSPPPSPPPSDEEPAPSDEEMEDTSSSPPSPPPAKTKRRAKKSPPKRQKKKAPVVEEEEEKEEFDEEEESAPQTSFAPPARGRKRAADGPAKGGAVKRARKGREEREEEEDENMDNNPPPTPSPKAKSKGKKGAVSKVGASPKASPPASSLKVLPRTNSRGTGLLKATSRAPVTLNRHGKTAVHLDRKKRLQEAIIRNKKLKLNESSLSAPSFMQ